MCNFRIRSFTEALSWHIFQGEPSNEVDKLVTSVLSHVTRRIESDRAGLGVADSAKLVNCDIIYNAPICFCESQHCSINLKFFSVYE